MDDGHSASGAAIIGFPALDRELHAAERAWGGTMRIDASAR